MRRLFALSALTLVIGAIFPRTASSQTLVLVAGGGSQGDGAPAKQAKLTSPFGVDFDTSGTLYFVEMTGHRVRKIDADGNVTTVAGNGKPGFGGDGGPASAAQLNGPHNLAIAPNGDLYVADTWNHRVRKIDAKTHVITTVVGTATKGYSGDGGPATKADFGDIYCAAFDPKGERLYLADLDNRRIRVLELKTGIVTTVAGNGQKGVPEDGISAVAAPLFDPRAVAVDAKGNVYILERSGHALRVVDAKGKVQTLIGNGRAGNTGDGGPARSAQLRGPKHLCVDHDGNVLIADSDNHRVRKYFTASRTMGRVAGTGRAYHDGLDGPPEKADLNQPHGVYVHPSGRIYIADSSNDRIVMIKP
jgi:DNA-binding beta-propeller fold protein YncE